MLELYYKYPGVLRRLRDGGLGGEMDRIAAYLWEKRLQALIGQGLSQPAWQVQ